MGIWSANWQSGRPRQNLKMNLGVAQFNAAILKELLPLSLSLSPPSIARRDSKLQIWYPRHAGKKNERPSKRAMLVYQIGQMSDPLLDLQNGITGGIIWFGTGVSRFLPSFLSCQSIARLDSR